MDGRETVLPIVSLRRFAWPREVVVDNIFRIPIVALQTPADGSHPRHVDGGGEDAEVVEGGVGDNLDGVATQNIWRHKSNWDVFSVF